MRAAILLLLLTACYRERDAVKQLQGMGRPEPVRCKPLNGNPGEANASYICTDGASVSWICDSDGCIKLNGSISPERQ